MILNRKWRPEGACSNPATNPSRSMPYVRNGAVEASDGYIAAHVPIAGDSVDGPLPRVAFDLARAALRGWSQTKRTTIDVSAADVVRIPGIGATVERRGPLTTSGAAPHNVAADIERALAAPRAGTVTLDAPALARLARALDGGKYAGGDVVVLHLPKRSTDAIIVTSLHTAVEGYGKIGDAPVGLLMPSRWEA